MKDQIEEFKDALQKSGLRITKSRLAVFTILERNKRSFLSPDEIFDKISRSKEINCDRASVYRVLSTLEEINLVNVSHFQGEATKYQIHHHTNTCDHGHDSHEHYFKCLKCESIQAIGDCFIDSKIKELESKGFKTLGHHLEITGHCPSCR